MQVKDKRFQKILVTGAPDAQEKVSDYAISVLAKMALELAARDGIVDMPQKFEVVRKVTA